MSVWARSLSLRLCSKHGSAPASPPRSDDDLAGIESLRVATGRVALNSPDTHDAVEGLGSEPPLGALCPEGPQQQTHLPLAACSRERNEHARRAQVTVVLHYFVAEDEMVAECIPGELGYEPVILMQVVTRMSEDHIGVDLALQRLEVVFEFSILAWKVAVVELLYQNATAVGLGQECLRARTRLATAFIRAAQHYPGHCEAQSLHEIENCTATANLQIIGVSTDAEQLQHATLVRQETQHAGTFRHSIHGHFPCASMRSKVILSLNVSMDSQNPSWRYVLSARRWMRRANGCSTSSSPS